ncbi:MAG: TetR/AcrR family transcriptional regulator [Microthrixaceae bacterium]
MNRRTQTTGATGRGVPQATGGTPPRAMGGASPWKAKPDNPEYLATRARMVDAAEEIVRDRGAGALRLESLAESVGLHRSSVYRYFDSKEELLTAVVVQATLRLGHEVIEALGPDAPPERFLVEGLAMALTGIANDPVHRSLHSPSTTEAVARVGGRALTEGLRPLVGPMFVTAADRGVLREGVTPDLALQWLQIVAVGLLRIPTGDGRSEELRELLELMLVPALLAI